MPRRRSSVLLALALAPTVAGATVYAPADDATLAAASAAIVTGTVTASVAHETSGRIVTDTTVAVDAVYKGALDGMTVTVTTPGGEVGDERVVVFGAPRFGEGERVLLYLQQSPDGEVRTTGLALGAYRLVTGADGSVTAVPSLPAVPAQSLDDLAALTQALGDPGGTVGASSAPATARFTFLGSPPGRWFEVDQGQPIRLGLANADAVLGATVSKSVVDAALAAWTDVPTAAIVLQRGASAGPARSVVGGTCDGKSNIQFNDPFGEIAPLSGCFGVLAVGGFCTKSTGTFDGQTFARISEGDLTIADGLGSCLGPTSFAEVLTHELGHVIGLGHSSENANEPNPTLKDATMYFLAHLDGRGASVRSDDVAGVSALYPIAANPNDTDGDGVPNADDACPTTPSGAAVDATGCACSDAGHVACDDGLACTVDLCDATSGTCAAKPVDCTNGDPCLTGTCDETVGCTTTPLTGDAGLLCVYRRALPPAECAGQRVPVGVRNRFRRAARLVARGLERGKPPLLAAAARQLDRAGRTLDRRTRRRGASACLTALADLLADARSRL